MYPPSLSATGTDLLAPAASQRRGWRTGLVVAAVVLLACAGALVGIGGWSAAQRMRELQGVAAALQAELDALPAARPAPWGETRTDTAWPHYERALAAVAKLDHALVARVKLHAGRQLAGLTPSSSEKLPAPEALLQPHAAALADLRAGAHADDSRRPMTWSAGYSHHVHNLLATRTLGNLAALDAYRALAAGRPTEAVQRLLDAMQFGRDLMQSPILIDQMIGCAVLTIPGFESMGKADLLRTLDAPALATLADGLARLDRSLPLDGHAVEAEVVLFANHCANLRGSYAGMFGPTTSQAQLALAAWRYGFNVSLAAADHGLQQAAVAQRIRPLFTTNDAVDLVALRREHDTLLGTDNPISRLCTPNLEAGVRNRLQTLALLRLMRMACQHAQGDTVAPLPDPHGGTLRVDVDEHGTATFWSDARRKHTEFTVRR